MVGKAVILSHGILVVAASFFELSHKSSPAFGKYALGNPIQSSILVLLVSGLTLLLFRNLITQSFSSSASTSLFSSSSLILPLQDLSLKDARLGPADRVQGTAPRSKRLRILQAAIAICVRVNIFYFVHSNTECVTSSPQSYLPLLLAIYDYWYIQRRKSRVDNNGSPSMKLWTAGSHSQLVPAFCIGLAGVLQTFVIPESRSTAICPLSSRLRSVVPILQYLGVLLDCYILISTTALVKNPSANDSTRVRFDPITLSTVFVIAATILSTEGVIALETNTIYRVEVFDFRWSFVSCTLILTLLFMISGLAAFRIELSHGLVHSAILVVFICIYSHGISNSVADHGMLLAISPVRMIFFLALLLAGGIIWLRNSLLSSGRSPAPLQRQTTGAKLASWAILMLLVVHLGWSQTSYDRPSPKTHPIETLMNEASVRFKSWTEQASSSKTLGECVEEYYRRYKRPPPPGFDAWYRFATAKSSIIIDDFDTLYDDLKPFWGITPAEIRLRTRQLYSDPFNEASEIIVRKGRAALGPNFLPTHRWMLDGILEMIKDFATYLPDMDLAFNLNDEPKVAVPFQALQKLGEASSGNHLNGDVRDRWSPDRAKTWQTPEDLPMTRLGEDYARTNSFSAGTFFCPPDSAAQRAYHWDSSALCTSCAVPHSSGVFLSNWSLAASPCHQPDLRNLHGFYLSPAAHKPSQHLLPIFSQSKPDGYADILYPSPWNYIDKVVYAPSEAHPDPPFSSKESTLFWRGATSEGVSRHGTWRGMVRQRLVHLASNPPPTSRSPTLPILLPDPSLQGKYAYQHLSTPLTTLNLSLDISIVNGIARAWDNDGAHQDREFSFVPPTDFQDHWRYRYLMDVDGAGFSGRFLPFLQSRSLPFRAGIFRTWWDSRLAAWRHFVPVDVRLHGLLSTLAYFMGAASPTGEVDGTLREHVEAGEEIAEAGRVWAGKVLRKEDMEIFMFRLLLEWGRLTDDNRDEIGFSV